MSHIHTNEHSRASALRPRAYERHDPKGFGDAFIKGLYDQPLLNPSAMGTVSLATRGFTG